MNDVEIKDGMLKNTQRNAIKWADFSEISLRRFFKRGKGQTLSYLKNKAKSELQGKYQKSKQKYDNPRTTVHVFSSLMHKQVETLVRKVKPL